MDFVNMIEKIKAEVRRLMNNRDSRLVDGSYYDFEHLLSFIESLEKEPRDCGKGIHKQEYTGCDMSWMDESQGLDEAAEEWVGNNCFDCDCVGENRAWDAFKAGAKWMAGQGLTKEAVIGMATEEISINVSQEALDGLDVCPGDKVIVQIRKK